MEDCGNEALFWKGIELFNQREFFDCHEVLEDFWKEQPEPERQLTQGIIQIAVAYYHSLRGNRIGAKKLLIRGIPRVKIFLPEFKGLCLKEFIADVENDLQSLSDDDHDAVLLIPIIKSASIS